MQHHSKFSLFALLTLMCVVVSGCTSTSVLSSDPQTSEDILRASTEHPAHIIFINGYRVDCYAVSVRKDSTRWRVNDTAAEVAIPTNSIYSINIPDPQIGGGIALGILGGAVLGGVIGYAATPAPSASNLDNMLGLVTVLDIMGGAALGILLGGISGGAIGASNGSVWTNH
jgi:hypothetical protein